MRRAVGRESVFEGRQPFGDLELLVSLVFRVPTGRVEGEGKQRMLKIGCEGVPGGRNF